MKKCAAGLAALFLIVIFLSPRAFAAGYELPEGTSITAQSAYFVNLDTGIVVFEQNADEQRSVASLTKLMTALLLMENVSDLENTKITAERSLYVPPITNPDSSTADIWPGETVSALNMLYAMMLPSANEAAEAVGYYLGNGNLNNFYALMNARAAALGCTNTNFTSTNGLVDMDEATIPPPTTLRSSRRNAGSTRSSAPSWARRPIRCPRPKVTMNHIIFLA